VTAQSGTIDKLADGQSSQSTSKRKVVQFNDEAASAAQDEALALKEIMESVSNNRMPAAVIAGSRRSIKRQPSAAEDHVAGKSNFRKATAENATDLDSEYSSQNEGDPSPDDPRQHMPIRFQHADTSVEGELTNGTAEAIARGMNDGVDLKPREMQLTTPKN